MEMSFQNEGFHQYMLLNISELTMENYEINMLMQFKGKSLLPLKLCGQNGRIQIRYDISGSATLEQVSKEHELKGAFLRTLFQTIWDCYEELEEYLLPVEGILLAPEMIYYQPGKKQIGFCYLPGQEDSFQHNFLNLIEFCMKHTDHEDSNAVMFIYGLYRYVQNGHMSREEIQTYIHNKGIEADKNEYIKNESAGIHGNRVGNESADNYGNKVMNESAGNYRNKVMNESAGIHGNGMGRTFTDDYNSGLSYETRQYEKERKAVKKTGGIGHERNKIREENPNMQKIAFYLYGSGFILSVCAMIVFGIRFFIITRQENDLKIFIILILVSMVLLYSAVRSKGKAVESGNIAEAGEALKDNIVEEIKIEEEELEMQQKQSVEPISEQASMRSTGQTLEQAFNQISGQTFEIWEETQVLKNISSESKLLNDKDIAGILFWEMESLNSSVPNIQLNRLPGVLGRKTEDVDYVVGGEGISRRHAMIFLSGSDLYVEDLNSTNGTYVDNVRLNPGEPSILKEEAILRIGPNKYRIRKK